MTNGAMVLIFCTNLQYCAGRSGMLEPRGLFRPSREKNRRLKTTQSSILFYLPSADPAGYIASHWVYSSREGVNLLSTRSNTVYIHIYHLGCLCVCVSSEITHRLMCVVYICRAHWNGPAGYTQKMTPCCSRPIYLTVQVWNMIEFAGQLHWDRPSGRL